MKNSVKEERSKKDLTQVQLAEWSMCQGKQ